MFSYSTKQKIQQRKAEQEKALDDKLAEETQHATLSDEMERRQRKVSILIFVRNLKKFNYNFAFLLF